MDITIRNIDAQTYRLIRARAALEKRNIGEIISQAIQFFLNNQQGKTKKFKDLPSWDFGIGTENLSQEVDDLMYGESK